MVSKFKIVGNYLFAPLESTESFDSKDAAQKENQKWTKDAKAQGLRWKGRVVQVDQAEDEPK